MNLHYREELGTTLSTAVFFSGISILFSAGVSEVTAFWFVDRSLVNLVQKNHSIRDVSEYLPMDCSFLFSFPMDIYTFIPISWCELCFYVYGIYEHC